ncbi:hypothetical protein ACS0TY_012020 [Phlomoides rotata]
MLKKVGSFSKDLIPDTCVTVCGVSELDAGVDTYARTVCVNQHQMPERMSQDIYFALVVMHLSIAKIDHTSSYLLDIVNSYPALVNKFSLG